MNQAMKLSLCSVRDRAKTVQSLLFFIVFHLKKYVGEPRSGVFYLPTPRPREWEEERLWEGGYCSTRKPYTNSWFFSKIHITFA